MLRQYKKLKLYLTLLTRKKKKEDAFCDTLFLKVLIDFYKLS